MKVKRLNKYGVNEFLIFIENIRSGSKTNIPFYLLNDERSSESIEVDIDVGDMKFKSRFEIGLYLAEIFGDKNIQALIGDQGFWSWFALLWFDQLCPEINGVRRASKEYNYVLSKNYNHRPRHAIYMTWQLVTRYNDDARFMLSKEPSIRGEITEQMMARQEILSSEGVMRLASTLYFDAKTGLFKKGAASRKSAGCVSRYVSWLQQLQVTFDIFSTTQKDLGLLLPQEFDRFKQTS
ncbi:hypothetical protein [Dasania marina]|uniref:hypothetical protein n=1 Tax=Dasania marina TaxID=471499 RepID=UPI0030DAC221|tara:strand:+ start:54412 stop:55122 length:711 start_codon:yes stop_codon:yes gene_type:complete